ncbi:MAG: PAS domain-containing protein [Pyrinomonadaceae bacterium]
MKAKNSKEKTDSGIGRTFSLNDENLPVDLLEAENVLTGLAAVFFATDLFNENSPKAVSQKILPDVTDIYRVLVEQIPAVVFIAFFDKSFGEAYVSPQIEAKLGFTQEEWLNDPVRWYQHIHPEDKERWSVEVAQMFLTGEPLHSVYRVLSRDGRVVRFQCEVKIVRHADGHPWFIHGTAFDITKQQLDEEALREYAERMTFLSRRLIEVQEAERRIIALELHDQIGQILTGLKLKLEMIARLPDDEVRESLDEAQKLVNELLMRTRELSLDLRPATLDHLGLLSALLRHLRHYTSQTNVQIDFRHEGLEGKRFMPELETAAFRIVQEALTNIARHSGAEQAIVHIWANQNTLTVHIEDNGKGFDPEAVFDSDQSSGLAGMRERASLLGGSFIIESNSEGTRLTAHWNLATMNGER